MTVRLGVLGAGRIARNLFRLLADGYFADVQLKAIVDKEDPKSLHYLLRYDTILGRLGGALTVQGDRLMMGNTQVRLLQGEGDTNAVAWNELGVDVVIDATGTPRHRAALHKHVERGAKYVITCVPPIDEFDAQVVMGVNHLSIKPGDSIIGHSSVAAHACLPILSLLQENFGIERLFYTVVGAYTNDQRLADVPAQTPRQSRAAKQNIVPDLGPCTRDIEAILPALRGKVSGMSLLVPVANGSLIDMVAHTKKPVSVQSVNDMVHAAASAGLYKNLVEYSTDPLVSSDVQRSSFSCTYDSLATMALGDHIIKTLAWYDNGWGFARRTLELAMVLHQLPGDKA
jgi:glyceraldehyde 3-phosphate dehydrogenase